MQAGLHYEAVAPAAAPRARPGRAARALAASALVLGAGALAAVVSRGWGPRGASTVLKTQNPATKESDLIEGFPAAMFMGGALTMAQFPPQCPRGGSGDFRCAGLAHDCAQCLDGSGSCFPRERGQGSIRLTKTDGVGSRKDYYYLNVAGPLGHELAVLLRSSDGYSREWNAVGDLWTDRIHQPCAEGRTPAAVDLVQVTDAVTGEMAFFRFPCEGSSRCGDEFVAAIPPPPPPPPAYRAPAPAAEPTRWVQGRIAAPPGPPGPPGEPVSCVCPYAQEECAHMRACVPAAGTRMHVRVCTHARTAKTHAAGRAGRNQDQDSAGGAGRPGRARGAGRQRGNLRAGGAGSAWSPRPGGGLCRDLLSRGRCGGERGGGGSGGPRWRVRVDLR
jgi:hypothetical protein